MIAFANTKRRSKLISHDRFLEMLPQIRAQAEVAFRSIRPEAKEELITEVIANAFVAFIRLVERDKADIAYSTPLARYAIRHVKAGRRVGTRLNVRDATSHHARLVKKIVIERLDQFDAANGKWRDTLIEDRKAGPAETAAARIDIADWLKSLSWNKRKIAKTLAGGETTSVVAHMFGLTASRVSQLRQELKKSWDLFQSQAALA